MTKDNAQLKQYYSKKIQKKMSRPNILLKGLNEGSRYLFAFMIHFGLIYLFQMIPLIPKIDLNVIFIMTGFSLFFVIIDRFIINMKYIDYLLHSITYIIPLGLLYFIYLGLIPYISNDLYKYIFLFIFLPLITVVISELTTVIDYFIDKYDHSKNHVKLLRMYYLSLFLCS